MPFKTKAQKRAWRKRPDVKQRQQEHVRNYHAVMAAAHGVSLTAFKRLYRVKHITQSMPNLCEHIRLHELAALKRRSKKPLQLRVIYPRRCVTCGKLYHSRQWREPKYPVCSQQCHNRRPGRTGGERQRRNERARERYRTDLAYRQKCIEKAARQATRRKQESK